MSKIDTKTETVMALLAERDAAVARAEEAEAEVQRLREVLSLAQPILASSIGMAEVLARTQAAGERERSWLERCKAVLEAARAALRTEGEGPVQIMGGTS